MSDIIVFEGTTEVIVANAGNVNKIIEEFFLNGGRNLDEYDVTIADGNEGVVIETRINAYGMKDSNYDVVDLMPNVLREALIEKGLLTDE